MEESCLSPISIKRPKMGVLAHCDGVSRRGP
jgi:hypothetical protein